MSPQRSEQDYNLFHWWYDTFFEKYISFKGRARRKEFWYFFLINSVAFIILFALIAFLIYEEDKDAIGSLILTLVTFSIYLLLLLPFIAVSVRRLHDTGKSGWWTVLCFIPYVNFVGWVILIFFWASNGETGPNQYGPDPKGSIDSEIDRIGKE